jgi:amino acid adenylation domain-containing protein
VLRKDALEKTYVELARRHETLRTTFQSTDGHPALRIAAEPNILFETVDLRHLPEVEREAEARRLSAEDARKPFDLTRGPLFRIRLFQIEDEEHVLYSNMHHIISDGWSFGVMAREIAALYTAFIKGKPADLPELPVQYADYALWQRQWLQGEALEAQLTYWKDKLGGELPVLELPTDRPRPAVQTHRGAIESFALPKELSEALQAISRREGVTIFMTLLAAFKTLLCRLTGQADIIVGTPIAGRNRTELEGLIGFFVNTIVMRTDLSGNPIFKELLGRVRETALGAYAYQDMPFEKLVEELAPERDLSRTPLFQVFFNHIVAMGDKAAELSGLEAEVVGRLEDRESKFDMTLYVLEGEGGIKLGLVYNTDLFDSWRMGEMLKQYEELLKQIVENPDENILHYSLVTATVKDRLPDPIELLPSQWEDAIHKRFSEQAHVGPDQVAVVDRFDSWTYGELECRSNQLANFLLENAVHPGDVVAIYAHRSASLVWSLLGILKAGAAFLLLDPAYPTQRLIDILQEAKPKAWFQIEAAGELAEELTDNVEAQVANCHLVLPGLASAVKLGLLAGYSDKDPEIVVGPDDLAYLAFTSGTTGEPKGIVGTHGPLSHFLNWHIEKFSLNESDRFSMFSGLSHDPLLRDIFTPLWAGATLCIPEPEKILFPAELISWMSAQRITVAHMTPALSQVFADGARDAESIKEILSSIRYIFFGGDVLTWRHVEKIKQIAPSAEFVNYYGATETPQAMGYHVVDGRKKGQFADGIPLGKGIEGVQLLVLNAAGRLAGVGEIAEVHVRTPYLSKGYLNDATLADAKFIGNPYTNTENDRIYKTGDLGRYLPDGRVMFHGRSDRQVSLRGFRIELGEVEATLCLHPSVSEAVVVAREDRPGDKRLVAYVVAAAAESAPSTSVLRAFLQEKLPDYMIPSAFVFLDALPLTANRKVDRRALPVPDERRPDIEASYAAPRSQTERMLADIWAEVLNVEQVGINDNFFDLGGHSLLMIRVLRKLQEIIEQDISMITLFQYPTIGSLSNYLSSTGIDQSSFERIYDRAERQEKAMAMQKRMQAARRRLNG